MKKQPTTDQVSQFISAVLIRSRTEPNHWALLTSIGDRYIEADIRPDTRRWLEENYDVEAQPQIAPGGETYETITLTKKPATAPEKTTAQ